MHVGTMRQITSPYWQESKPRWSDRKASAAPLYPALMLGSRAASIGDFASPRLAALRGVSKHEGAPASPFETRARTFNPCETAAACALLRVSPDDAVRAVA